MADWNATPTWARIAMPRGASGAAVAVRPLEGLGLATVLARKGQETALVERVRGRFGLDLPDGPRRASGEAIAFVATGPGAWLAVAEAADASWLDGLKRDLTGLASVSDQSDGYAAVRLEGPAVVDMLAKGVFLDLHPDSFPPGSAAGISIAHVGVVIWRREEGGFDLLCFRSYAQSLWRWIEESGAEYGLAVV